MEAPVIFGIPALNFQALLGVFCFLASILIAKVVNRILAGKMAGGSGTLIYLRTLLGFLLAAAVCFFFGSLMSIQLI